MAEMDKSEESLQYRTVKRRLPALEPEILLEAGLLRLNLLDATPKGTSRRASGTIGYSDRQSRRIFREALGEPLASFVKRMRLERAAGQLSAEPTPISKIAAHAKYNSSAAFSKAFASHFACSPAEFRVLNRSEACLMPGYLVTRTGLSDLPRSVRIRTAPDVAVTLLYDGPVFLGKVLPGGRIDWSP